MLLTVAWRLCLCTISFAILIFKGQKTECLVWEVWNCVTTQKLTILLSPFLLESIFLLPILLHCIFSVVKEVKGVRVCVFNYKHLKSTGCLNFMKSFGT